MKPEELERIRHRLLNSQKILIGIGGEWRQNPDTKQPERIEARPEVINGYLSLYKLIKDRDYFIITTVTDGEIFRQPFNPDRIVAPCGNITWRQCENACTKDIWEEGEVENGRCPHCGSALVPNTSSCKNYIEEGYLPKWKAYTEWLTRTLNKSLTALELGEGFLTPTVIRWPFEKTVFFNQQAWLYRIHHEFPQISEELKERAEGIRANSVDWICSLAMQEGKERL